MNVKRHLLIFLLASWLPMQSLAAMLLHCELIEHPSVPFGEMPDHDAFAHELPGALSTQNPVMHAGHSAAVSVEAELAALPADCHGQPAPSNQIELIETPLLSDDEAQCNHCNGSCHGIQQLSLSALDNGFVSTLNKFSPSSAAAEISSIPENPQRPPKLS